MKKKRLFYYEEAVNCYIPAPEKVENIIDLTLFDAGDKIEIVFKVIELSDEEMENLPEAD